MCVCVCVFPPPPLSLQWPSLYWLWKVGVFGVQHGQELSNGVDCINCVSIQTVMFSFYSALFVWLDCRTSSRLNQYFIPPKALGRTISASQARPSWTLFRLQLSHAVLSSSLTTLFSPASFWTTQFYLRPKKKRKEKKRKKEKGHDVLSSSWATLFSLRHKARCSVVVLKPRCSLFVLKPRCSLFVLNHAVLSSSWTTLFSLRPKPRCSLFVLKPRCFLFVLKPRRSLFVLNHAVLSAL